MIVIAVHGGVAGHPLDRKPKLDLALAAAQASGSPLDAVEAAVQALEDDPALNAGYGAVLNRAGHLELDAGIADGRSQRFGGVTAVVVRHPITLARRVMERSPHVLLAGKGAMLLGEDLELLEGTTEEQESRWQRAHEMGELSPDRYGIPETVDTVGAVALDEAGNLAAASSTGGIFGKFPGRVGDSAIFGAGFYASTSAAVVSTGVGEALLGTLACFRAASLIEKGLSPEQACEQMVTMLQGESPTIAALLAIDIRGRIGGAFTGAEWPLAANGDVHVVQLGRQRAY